MVRIERQPRQWPPEGQRSVTYFQDKMVKKRTYSDSRGLMLDMENIKPGIEK
jgi:hypothetical protein